MRPARRERITVRLGKPQQAEAREALARNPLLRDALAGMEDRVWELVEQHFTKDFATLREEHDHYLKVRHEMDHFTALRAKLGVTDPETRNERT